jgi:hypothetical protein
VGIRISAAANDPPEDASDIITVVVGEPTGALGMAQPLLGTMAAAFTRIPEAARAIGVYAAIFAGIFFLLIFAYPKISRQLSAPRKKKF